MPDYPQRILDYYDDPYHRGDCEHPTHAAENGCGESGCQLRIELRLQEDQSVEEAWFDGRGCMLCEALTSMLLEFCEGRMATELVDVEPANFWESLGLQELGSLDRQSCSQLPLNVLHEALESPVDPVDWDAADGTHFGGPSLREEC